MLLGQSKASLHGKPMLLQGGVTQCPPVPAQSAALYKLHSDGAPIHGCAVAALLRVNGVVQVLELHKCVVALDLNTVQGAVPAGPPSNNTRRQSTPARLPNT